MTLNDRNVTDKNSQKDAMLILLTSVYGAQRLSATNRVSGLF